MQLATAADSVLVWDASSLVEPQLEYREHGDAQVYCARWNHNNRVIASSGDDGSILLHSDAGTRDLMGAEPGAHSPALALAFSGGSRFLCAGGADSVIRLWDLRQQASAARPRRIHAHGSAVTCVCWAPERAADSARMLLTAGSELGEVTTHAVRAPDDEPACVSRLMLGDGQLDLACTAVQYSPIRRTTLASADSSGAVRLWDIAAASRDGADGGAPTHEFAEHSLPCAGLAWSAVNQLLLASVGADGTIVFYDTAQRKAVKRVQLDSGLTCAAFFGDGVTIAVGTDEGAVHLFDLRKSLTPLQSAVASASGSPVADIMFQHVLAPPATAPSPSPSPSAADADADADARERTPGSGERPAAAGAADEPAPTRQHGRAERVSPELREQYPPVAELQRGVRRGSEDKLSARAPPPPPPHKHAPAADGAHGHSRHASDPEDDSGARAPLSALENTKPTRSGTAQPEAPSASGDGAPSLRRAPAQPPSAAGAEVRTPSAESGAGSRARATAAEEGRGSGDARSGPTGAHARAPRAAPEATPWLGGTAQAERGGGRHAAALLSPEGPAGSGAPIPQPVFSDVGSEARSGSGAASSRSGRGDGPDAAAARAPELRAPTPASTSPAAASGGERAGAAHARHAHRASSVSVSSASTVACTTGYEAVACATGAAAAPAPLATTFAAELAASSTQLGAKLEEALQDTREALHADIRDLHVELLRQFQLCTAHFERQLERNNEQVRALSAEVGDLRAQNASLAAQLQDRDGVHPAD